MKIWILCHDAMAPSLGGVNRHHFITRYLNKWGHDVRIFTSSAIHNSKVNMIDGDDLYTEKEVDGVVYTYVRSSNYQSNGWRRIYNMLQFSINLLRVCRRFQRPDVIYTSSPDIITAFVAMVYAKSKKLPAIMEVRDIWPDSIVEYGGMSKNHPIIKALYLVEKWLYRVACQLIFTVEGGRQYLTDKGWDKKIALSKVHYINNGVDIAEFDKNKEEYALSDKDLLNPETYKLIYAGSIRRANNLQRIVDAAQHIKQTGNDQIEFLIYGDGPYKGELEALCAERGLDNIKFKGRIDKKYIPFILSCADLNILNYMPSNLWKYGSSQNKLFEYLASGKPVLSTVEIGYSIVKKYNAGIEIGKDDAQAIADAILQMYHLSDEEKKRMCANARRAAEEFDMEIIAKQVEKVLISK